MVYLRQANSRGAVDFGWLRSKHSFSFGHYYDPKHMGFSVLRVINDDIVAPGRGFETHGHRDMEIISYVVSGALKHKDSTGNEYIVPAGDIQVMSAGKGIMHSEFNPSKDEAVNFLQIWIVPSEKGGEPQYSQRAFGNSMQSSESAGAKELLVSQDGSNDSLTIKQDASITRIQLNKDEQIEQVTEGRKGYLHVVSGTASVMLTSEIEAISVNPGDGVGIYEHETVKVVGNEPFVALWFDLPS
jgi:redox-sensitive bicupin YhaK (pirin superfamily)